MVLEELGIHGLKGNKKVPPKSLKLHKHKLKMDYKLHCSMKKNKT
jgi:hypothetical protein